MAREVQKIDENGFLLFGEQLVVEDGEECPEGYIDAPVPEGLLRPRWINGAFVEGATQQEIDERLNQPPAPKSPIQQLEEENAFLALELATTQSRLDQAEQEQADLLLMLVAQGVI